jgi:acyl-CoA oxidase
VLKNEKNREVMALCFRLFGAEVINRDLGFYMLQGVVNTEAAKALTAIRHEIIKKVASNAVDILDCLNIPKHALYAPIAGDYVKYNSSPNYGEIVGSRL